MALALNDRVKQTGTANTTVSFTLSGASAGFQSFAVIGNGNTTYYSATDASGGWEVGIGSYSTTGPTLTRTTILSSSNSGSAVTFSGTVDVWVTYPSEKSVNQDASGTVNILTNVPNTTTNVGTLNVGDGTYSYSQTGQLASFASNEPIVNSVSIQNTSTSNTAYSSIQLGANNYNTGYFLELGTNSSTYSYSAAGYPNSSINQPNTNYILANKADLGIATWDANNIHFIQNASVSTTDSMTLYASGGVSLGGNPDPGLGTLYASNVYLGFNTITAAAGTTILTNASAAWQQIVGTTTQNIQMPNATTLYKGLAYTIANNSTGNVTVKDNASATLDTTVTGGTSIMVLTDNSTSAGTWKAYSYLPASYDFSASTANFGNATITSAVWNGTTIGTAYGGTGLTTFAGANNAIYSTSSSALAAGTLPVAAGGTGSTTFTANNVLLGNGTSALQVVAPGTSGNVLTSNGTTWTSATPASGLTITSTTTNANYNLGFQSASSGTTTVDYINTSFTANPSTGALTAPNVVASNGLLVNSNTVSASYSIPSGSSAIGAGPITVASGVTVTIPSGSRWVVL